MARRRQANANEEPLPKLNRETLRQAIGIYKYIRPYRWSLFFGLILLFMSSLVFMLFPYLAGRMVDIAQGNTSMGIGLPDFADVDVELDLQQIGWALLAVLILQGIVSYTRVLLFARVSEKGIGDIRQALYARLVTLPIVFFEKSRIGELVSRLTGDVEKLYSAFSITLAEFIRQIIILVVGIAFLAFRAPQLSLIMLATFPVIVIGAMIFGGYIRKLSKERQEELANTNTILNETMQAIHVVKAFTNEFFESLRYNNSVDRMVNVALKYAHGRAIFSVFIITFLFGALFFIIWRGAIMVSNGTMTAGLLIEFVVYTGIIGGAIAGLGNFYTDLLGAIGATERIREILNTEGEVEATDTKHSPTINLQGNIAYENVHFEYPTRSDVPVLKGLSFEVQAGQKVALVGTSGAGKSTIVSLLLQFYGISEGDIKVDGKSIYEYDLSAFRQNIAIVPQEVLLFGGTIQENIRYGKPDATEEEIIEAARQANAWDFIQSFPEGLDTIVGERGIKLSGGQRQRIAIARAILKDPCILLLDEATSSLDAESEKMVQDALNTLMEGRTSIIIAHRLATIRDVDCIYVIDNGKIIEQGTHDELSMLEDGAYNSLAKLQFEASTL